MKQNRGRRLVGALLLAGCLVLSGCSRAKPELAQAPPPAAPTAEAAPTTSPPVFRLRAPVGSAPEQLSGSVFTITVENCDASDTLESEHSETVYMASSLVLDLRDDNLAAHAATIERLVRHTYGIDEADGHQVTDATPVRVAGGHRAMVHLRWNAIWDRNSVEVVRDGAVVAEVPVRVLMAMELESLGSDAQPCAPSTEALPAPTATLEPAPPPQVAALEELPGSDEAIALVRDYVRALDEGRLKDAYALLHPDYQARHPYERWASGYAAISQVEIRLIESMRIDANTDEVLVGLTLTADVAGRTSYADWMATYRVVVTRGHPPYQRTIYDVRMRPMGVG